MAEVFISYARINESTAKRIADALKLNGFKVWRDDQLPTHRAYNDIIEQKLRSAVAVVVLWSKDSVHSQWVRAEAELARTEDKLVQGLLDGTMPPLPFNQIQCANLKRWGGNPSHPGWIKLLDGVSALAHGERAERVKAPHWGWIADRWRWATAGVVAALIVALVFAAIHYLIPAPEGPSTIAVLPFKALASDDKGLVYGMWEDTRQALTRNPQLRVLGRESVEALAQQKLRPQQYRSKLGVAYLLDGTVQRIGNRVRINVSLVRTKDGSEVWSDVLDRRLDDVFALQSQVANEIEGRIRGRLAPGGGVKPANIVTSGAVYLLYSEARATLSKRQYQNVMAARQQLKQAVQMDPNYAPAWAALAVAQRLSDQDIQPGGTVITGHEAEAYARRAITLAPNLAAAHAALGFALGNGGPVAEAALRRAVQLNPNDAESLNWLAALEADRGRITEALTLYDRAIQVEPLWWPVVLNRLNTLLASNDASAVQIELARVKRTGDERMLTLEQMAVLTWRGDFAEAARIGLAYYRHGPRSDMLGIDFILGSLLFQLGDEEQGIEIARPPPFAPLVWHYVPQGLGLFEAMKMPEATFWSGVPVAEIVSPAYVALRRGKGLVRLYQAAGGTPERLRTRLTDPGRFVLLAPVVALALRQTGNPAAADRLIAEADKTLTEHPFGPTERREYPIYVARIRAVEGRLPEAVAALHEALARDWLPLAPTYHPDIALDPPLALLKGSPEFEQARSSILAHMARERAELGPVSVSPLNGKTR